MISVASRSRVPLVVKNLRAARVWRPRDMMNWHRMVRPLRGLARGSAEFDVYHLIYEMCTRLSIDYRPHDTSPDAGPEEMPPIRPGRAAAPGEPRVAVFLDSPDHTSGVATTLGQWLREAGLQGRELRVYTSGFESGLSPCVAFPPVGTLHLAAYNGLHLHMPKVKDVLDHFARQAFDVVHVSTPGPMGLLGLLAGRRHGLPVCGTYHTDLPRYASALTGDSELENVSWQYMRWFYGQMDRVATPSESTRRELIEHGFDPARVTVVGRGINPVSFSPAHRDEALRARWGLKYRHKLLYVGRVSEEKNMACLTEAYRRLARRRLDACLVVVGEGPYLDRMMKELAGLPVVFTGLKKGRELSRIYASCDLFVFPSETDTYGVVLIEAQASGLPVVVSSQGGPKDCVVRDVTGRVLDTMNPDTLCDAVDGLLDRPGRLAEMGRSARRYALTLTPEAAFAAFWDLHRTRRDPAPAVGEAELCAVT